MRIRRTNVEHTELLITLPLGTVLSNVPHIRGFLQSQIGHHALYSHLRDRFGVVFWGGITASRDPIQYGLNEAHHRAHVLAIQ